MPVFRYFLYVGAALIAVLFAINAYAPQAPAPMQANAPGFDRTTIRITSNRVADAPIVYDTTQPTIVPPPRVAETRPVNTANVAKNDGTSSTADRRVEAMAQIDTPLKPTASKPKPKPRKIARHDYPRQQYAQRQAWAQQSFFPNIFGSW
ncbi:hypothetical protein [Bradyrhizobium sp. SYSU BS000235]|uniref:hypothetical protein n=1 Tax=Bradyrhizobium sp. SYSU BS000235 TaxID=3411332 RepID=UPI003C794591